MNRKVPLSDGGKRGSFTFWKKYVLQIVLLLVEFVKQVLSRSSIQIWIVNTIRDRIIIIF